MTVSLFFLSTALCVLLALSSSYGFRAAASLSRGLGFKMTIPSALDASTSSRKSDEPLVSSSKTCKNCKKQFSASSANECRYHPGYFTGRLNRINDVDTSDLEFFWSCCGEYSNAAEGCLVRARHYSYDDDDPEKFSPYGIKVK